MPEAIIDSAGDPHHPAVLLVGVGDADVTARLVAGARHVLRHPGPLTPAALDDLTDVHLVVPVADADLARAIAAARPDRIASVVVVGAAAADPAIVVIDDADPVPALLHHTSGGWDPQADRLAHIAVADGRPTAWFEQLYSSARRGEVPMPWDRSTPNKLLEQWTDGRDGTGRRALVIGCGLGADAEHLARLGYQVDAFDIAESAIETARARYADSSVRYRVADLLDPPADLLNVFDLVVDIFTVQALPTSVRKTAVTNVGRFVGPNGILIAVGIGQDEEDIPLIGPPWPLSRADIDSFATNELIQVRTADHRDAEDPGWFRWLAEFRHVSKDSGDQAGMSGH